MQTAYLMYISYDPLIVHLSLFNRIESLSLRLGTEYDALHQRELGVLVLRGLAATKFEPVEVKWKP